MTNQNEMDLIPDDLTQEELLSLNEILLNTREQCQMTAQLIENQIRRKDQLIDRLHQELEAYKQDQPARLGGTGDEGVNRAAGPAAKARKAPRSGPNLTPKSCGKNSPTWTRTSWTCWNARTSNPLPPSRASPLTAGGTGP